jgi:transcription-repair coupling factor (superfamily II helicase)
MKRQKQKQTQSDVTPTSNGVGTIIQPSEPSQAKERVGLQADTTVVFGSETALNGGSDEYEEEEEYDREQRERRRVVQNLLKEQDDEFREERRKKVWGEFADAKTKDDIIKVQKSIEEKLKKENEMKADAARGDGIVIDFLEVPEVDRSAVWDEDGTIQIKAGSSKAGDAWYSQMDEELKEEWEGLQGSAGPPSKDGDDTSADGDEEDDDGDDDDSPGSPNTVAVNGKIVSREALKGVRVGSAGGWTLEVFPGDFVVHRKYGIGRFERTLLRPKTKLSKEEREARDKRRRELVLDFIEGSRGGKTQQEIQAFQTRFGTDADEDPISNPRQTVLEISYKDGIVHVPVDRAYRLSRYRAGDSVVKPKLSKVRGDQWKNARRKVEETTLEMAQDVLALYATRETLTRQPFDPAKEYLVKEFEETFQFEPTKDQQKCFEDVENDMVWRSRPMDRLVCGDVG